MNANSDKEYCDAKADKLRTVMDVGFVAVGSRFEAMDFVRWLVGMFVAGMTIIITVLAFMFNNLASRLPPSQPAQQTSAPPPTPPAAPVAQP